MPAVGAPPDAIERIEKRGGPAVAAGASSATDADTIRFRVSNEDVDAFGDIVVQRGLEIPPTVPAVVDHAPHLEKSVGEWGQFERGDRETFATLRLLPAGVSRVADLVRAIHVGGFPLASSVHFDIARQDIEPITKTEGGRQVPTGGKRYNRGKVREISLTQFPANPSAVAVARSLGFDPAELAALSRPEPAPAPPPGPSSAVAGAPASRGLAMTFADTISAAQAALDSAQAGLGTATLTYETDSSDANLQAIQRSTAEIDRLFERLNTLRAAEAAASRRAAAAPAPAPAAPTAVSRAVVQAVNGGAAGSAAVTTRRTETRAVPPGTRLAQMVIARSVACETRRPIDQVAQEMFGAEPEVIAIARSLVGVADTTTAGWAAELVRSETRAMLQTELVAMSAWAALAVQGITINFAGAQTVVIPQMDVGKTVDGAWVGEGGAIPLVKGNLAAKRLSRYKVGGIVPITKELQRTSDPDAVEVMRRFLRQVLANLLDASLLSNSAEVPGVRPAGLLNGVTPITAAAGGGPAAVQADILALLKAFNTAGVRGRFVLLMSELAATALGMMTNALGQKVYPEAAQGQLGPATIIPTPMLADNIIIAVSVDHFASAFDPLETDVNEAATLQMANADATAPTHAGAGQLGGALGTARQVPPDGGIPIAGGNGASIAGSVALSMWQTWSLAVRMVMPASFGVTKAGSVQVISGVTWTPALAAAPAPEPPAPSPAPAPAGE